VTLGELAGTTIKLSPTDKDGKGRNQWTIGSDEDRDIIFAERGVSGRHAVIVNEGKRWKIINDISRSGTFVNGKRTNSSSLSPGDELRFGSVACVFELPRRAAAADRTRVPRSGQTPARIAVIALVVSFILTIAIIIARNYL
jgi:pSer/pThr/pTyr-binding forkhead associated (FHA) protein